MTDANPPSSAATMTDEKLPVEIFGDYVMSQSQSSTGCTWTQLQELDCSKIGDTVWLRAHVHNARGMGNCCFLVLRSNTHTAQAAMFKSDSISKEFIKFCSRLSRECIVDVLGTVQAACVQSCTQSHIEIVPRRIYCVSRACRIMPVYRRTDGPSPLPSHLRPVSNPMSFKDVLRLALAPNAGLSEHLEHIPRELHLGQIAYSWTNKKLERKNITPGFRQLGIDQLQRLMRRLQAAPPNHVILLNLSGNHSGGFMLVEWKGCTAVAGALPHLLALQVLILSGNCFRHFSFCFAV